MRWGWAVVVMAPWGGCGRTDAPTADRMWLGDEVDDVAGRELDVGSVAADGSLAILIGTPHLGGEYVRLSEGTYIVPATAPSGRVADAATESFVQVPGTFDLGNGVALVGDVTGDGVADVALAYVRAQLGAEDIGVSIYSSDRTGTVALEDATSELLYDQHTDQPSYVASCGDVDGDGFDDLCTGSSLNQFSDHSEADVFFGPLPAGTLDFAGADVELTASPWEWAGQGLRAGGSDIDGDGLPELLVPAAQFNEDQGKVYVVADPAPGRLDLNDFPSWVGEVGSGEAGGGTALGGDMDGDGLSDMFVGAHLWDDRRGRAYVVTNKDGGSLADAHAIVESTDQLDMLGRAAAIGDFDGDGASDLAIGAPRDIYFGFDRPGRVAVLLGPLPPGSMAFRDADLVFSASRDPDAFGFQLDAGDFDGDGRDELVVGAPYDSTAFSNAGAVYLYYGATLWP